MPLKVVFSEYDYEDYVEEDENVLLDKDELDEEEIESELKRFAEEYPFYIYYSLEGHRESEAHVYFKNFNDAMREFRDILDDMVDDCEGDPPLFPKGREKQKQFVDACTKLGTWDSDFSWKIMLLPSDKNYVSGNERKEFMIKNGVSEKDFEKAKKIITSYERYEHMI